MAALNALAKHLGLLTKRHIVEDTVEHTVAQLTPAERIERERQLQEKARTYLPRYEAALETIDGVAQQVDEEHG